MTADLIDILVLIIEGINKNQSFEKITESVNRKRKVNNNLVAAIYSWIFDKITREIENTLKTESFSSGKRVLSDKEKEIIGTENFNYILHLQNLGLLNNSDIEKIIEQAVLYSEGELDLEQLNLLVLSIFLESNSDLPPGSRLLLYSSDTIN